MDFGEAIGSCLRQYAVFSGRAPRSEYWWFALFLFLVQIAALFVEMVAHVNYLSNVVQLAFFLPQLSVAVRRLHDVNRSGWWIGIFYIVFIVFGAGLALFMFTSITAANPGGVHPLTNFPPSAGIAFGIFGLAMFVYGITLFVFSVMRGTNGPNDYGPDPLASSPLT